MKTNTSNPGRSPLKTVAFLAVLAGVVIALLSLPVWRIRAVEVRGNSMVPEGLIKEKAEIPMDENVFFLNYGEISRRVSAIRQIKAAQVSGRLPSSVVITVEERKPFAVAAVRGRYLVFDNEGFIIESLGPKDAREPSSGIKVFELPTVVGLPADSVVENKRIDPQTMKAIEFSFVTLGRIMSKGKFELELVSFSEMNIIIDDLLKVKIGSPDDIEKKFFNLSKILASISDKNSVEYIDLRAKDFPAVKFRNRP